MGHLTKYWKKYRRLFFISIFCVSCEAACDLLQPRLMSRLIDEGAAKKDLAYVTRLGLLMLAVAGAGAVFALVRNISASRASQGFGADIRSDMFSKMQSFSVEEMDAFEGGSLVVRMTSDITQLQNFAGGMMRIFFKAPIMCIGAIIMASTLNYRTLPIIAPIIAAVAFVIALTMRLTYPRFAKVQKALDRLNTTMREYLAGVRLVKAFGSYELEENRFSGANGELAENTIKAGQTLAIFSPFMALFVNCGIAAIIFLGAGWVSSGQMQVGAIVAFVTYMAQILGSLGMISNVLNMFVRVKTSNDRIREVFLSQDEAHNRQDTGEKTGAKSGAHIAFEGVGFEYRGSTGQAALSGLGFFVEKGETLGVIGPTGSGKSTLAALLMRFYPASSGAIYISGKNIESLP
ncbi:MAG: ABC transporter ATP-binding protein, partial [Oscillospiraceae bacterium]|nr:ABC transporter ATP-binding protein [Oscillospiraceae bacterium]